MTLRTTITFERHEWTSSESWPLIKIRIDRAQAVGLKGTKHVEVSGLPIDMSEITTGDICRLDEVRQYLEKLTGLRVRIETETV